MGKRESAALLALAVSGVTGTANADTRLSAQELRWARAASPVVAYARTQGLPVDVVVQPQDAPGLAPVAMALVDGRCKLVFSMRGNPAAEETERSIPPALFTPIVEAIAAHEVAHCWRQVRGAWRTVPAGFSDPSGPVDSTDPDVVARWSAMAATRREEGFADLVGLAWTWRQHPAQYAQVHAWLMNERANPPLAGSHHDTQAWVRLAANGGFGDADSPFEQVTRMWTAGLVGEP
jgi:hypothetical protein